MISEKKSTGISQYGLYEYMFQMWRIILMHIEKFHLNFHQVKKNLRTEKKIKKSPRYTSPGDLSSFLLQQKVQ
jgi:hypothetical protein